MSSQHRSTLWRMVGMAFVFCAVVGATLATQRRAEATANWSRKYNIKCNACHEPSVPRLNRKGQTFRKLGFRFPEEVGEKPEYKEMGEFLALRLRPRYTYNNPKVAGGRTDSQFRVNDATIFYNGPVTQELSINAELEYENLENFQGFGALMWFQGTAERYWRFRVGQMHTVPRVGFGVFDRPSGISTTDIINSRLTNTPVPFRLAVTRQRGFEAAYSPDADGRIIFQVLNGMNPAGAADKADVDNDRDFILAYERIIDEHGSSFTLYGYKGTWHQQRVVGGVTQTIVDSLDEFDFTRYGAAGNYIFPAKEGQEPWEVLGGIIWARDEFPSAHAGPGTPRPGAKASGTAWMVELQKWLPHDAALFVRYDKLGGGVNTKKVTVGKVYNVNDNLRLGLELAKTTSSVAGAGRPLTGVLEAMFNF